LLQAFRQGAFLVTFLAAFFVTFLAAFLTDFFTAFLTAFFAAFFGIVSSPEKRFNVRDKAYKLHPLNEMGSSLTLSKQFCPQKQFIPSKRTKGTTAKFILQRKRSFLFGEKHIFLKEVDNFGESLRRFAEASVIALNDFNNKSNTSQG
jgi:hypothetical protein